MRAVDRLIFAEVASDLRLWILVRETNARSCHYIGLPDYAGKPFDIKVKTADEDVGRYLVGGLVADPTNPAIRAGFSAKKLAKAIDLWNDFLKERPPLAEGKPSGPYALITDPNHRHYGCLTLNGKCIHGDFDLYDIVEPDRPTANLGLVRTVEPPPGSFKAGTDIIPYNWTRVSKLINARVGKTMIYHGGDMQWFTLEKDACHADDTLEVFSPEGEHKRLTGRRSIAAFYGNHFPGRKTLRQRH